MITQNEISSLNLSPTKKDFVQIWNELIEVASKITERWDPTSTNESDPGIVLLKVLAGIADKLNYNIDKNILEAYMPTAAQMESMRKLCELVGYDIKYYQSAETTARISYTGNTTDFTEANDEKLPSTGLAIPKFTTLTNADKDITFVTTNAAPMLITNITPWVEVSCIEGQISQCESTNEYNLITLAQLDDRNRYYLPEVQIAENGIFVYNAMATADGYTDGTPWDQVSNLNTKAAELRVFKFGYDSFEARPYLAFPDDIGSLIGDGLFIYFVRTSGLSGNISPRTLEVLEVPTGKDWENYSAELFEVVNVDATTNGANIESISTAYNNFKKTVGTFDTLVTCRDYMNKIYSLMDVSNSPYVSNVLVTDIRNDINGAVTLCSCNEFGILYKETPLIKEFSEASSITAVEDPEGSDNYKVVIKQVSRGTPLIDHFDLRLYPFKTFTQVSSSTKDLVTPYNKSFTYTEQMNREIEASIADFKTCAHNLTTPADGDIVAINNYLRLNALIATSTKVSEIEAKAILDNVKAALVNEFNLRNLDFGEEIPFDAILSVIENADSRIKAVSLQEPTVLTTYSVKEYVGDVASSKEYGIASTTDSVGKPIKVDGVNYGDTKTVKGELAEDIYNKLVLRNILAGRASLFDYDESFISNNSEKPYTVTKNLEQIILDIINSEMPAADKEAKEVEYANIVSNAVPAMLEAIPKDANGVPAAGEYVVYAVNENNEPIKGQPLKGLYGGILTLNVFSNTTEQPAPVTRKATRKATKAATPLPQTRVYESYTPALDAAGIIKDNIITDVTRVEAVCELESDSSTFNNVTLGKNEVIKFRAPNLVTTKTFPAYVYYHFEHKDAAAGSGTSSGSGREYGSFAKAMTLGAFIDQDHIGAETFFSGQPDGFSGLLNKAGVSFDSKDYTFEANLSDPSVPKISKPDITKIFNTAIAIEANQLLQVRVIDPVTQLPIDPVSYEYYPTKLFVNEATFYNVLNEHFSNSENKTSVKFRYYPLTRNTSSNWSACVRALGTNLPSDDEILYQLSSTSSYPRGKLVMNSGKKLISLDPNALDSGNVRELVYVCTDYGSDPDYAAIEQKTEFELGPDDKLYIHYTPSSTNEDGETVNAEPISVVYKGGSEEPVIIKPSGFTLMPSDDLNKQGTSWKKTDVDFGGVKKNLMSLAPNEQIEMRSISRVVLNTHARFYRNFDAKELDGNINKTESYELKDGEYIFYTDQSTQEAAYYGSGSVITLDPGAFIPKASDQVEISQILEKGLHIVPWSNYVLLSDSRKITITEYQYVTLTEGDKLNTLTLEEGNSIKSGEWQTCNKNEPIKYTTAGAESPTELHKIALLSGNNTTWEVCSFLELSTSPGLTQELRATKPNDINSDEGSTVTVTNKLKVYTAAATGEKPSFEISPQITVAPPNAAGLSSGSSSAGDDNADVEYFEPISIKLDTIAKTASGSFEKTDSDLEDNIDDTKMRMKVFSTVAPTLVELADHNDEFTPISALTKYSVPAEPTSENLNNYWTKLDVKKNLLASEDAEGNTTGAPYALNLNFMIPEKSGIGTGTDTTASSDLFGIFSIYLAVPDGKLDPASSQHMLKGPSTSGVGLEAQGCRVFIDIPNEFGVAEEAISIFNLDGNWWSEGKDISNKNRLYLRAGLNCIRVNKSCNILIKAEPGADGSVLYDNLRLIKGRKTNGVNLALLDPNATFNVEAARIAQIENPDSKTIEDFDNLKVDLANKVLNKIAELDRDHDFYYNVPVENSLAIEFDDNISSLSNPYTLYDINNINNSFVVSKLDVAYLKDGLKIAKSSRY